jgi:phosphoribosylformylglycinamidine (FGAM) synthase-like enzyme
MMQLSNKHYDGGLCTAICTISNIEIPIQMDLEKDSATEDDFSLFEEKVIKMLVRYESKQEVILNQAVKEIVNAAYEQTEYKPSRQDYLNLKLDMELEEIYAVADGLVLAYLSPQQYPDFEITVQLSKRAVIEDVCLNEKDN